MRTLLFGAAAFLGGCGGVRDGGRHETATRAPPVDSCAPRVVEARALRERGQLIGALARLERVDAADGCAAEDARLATARAELRAELGEDGTGDSVERAEALIAEAKQAAGKGDEAAANRAWQRARRVLERLGHEPAVRLTTQGAEPLHVGPREVWLALGDMKSGHVASFELRGEPPQLAPLSAVPAARYGAKLLIGARHPELSVVSDGSHVTVRAKRGTAPLVYAAHDALLLPDEERLLLITGDGLSLRRLPGGEEISRAELAKVPRGGRLIGDHHFLALDEETRLTVVDLARMKVVVDLPEVRVAEPSSSGTALAVVIPVEDKGAMVDSLLLWKADALDKPPQRVAFVGSWQMGEPGISFDREEKRAQIGYTGLAALGQRPRTEIAGVYDVATGRRAPANASGLPAADHYAEHERNAAEMASSLSPGYRAVSERFSIAGDSFWPPSAKSEDGSTIALIEARLDGQTWRTPKLVIFDRATRKVKQRKDLGLAELHVLSVGISPHGRWALVCVDYDGGCNLFDASTGAVAPSPLGGPSDASFSSDDRFIIGGETLFEVATKKKVVIPPAVCRVGGLLVEAEVCPP